MTIKTVIFDFGGVIYKMPGLGWIKKWQGVLGIQDATGITEMLENPNESQLINDICLGKTSEDQTWKHFTEKFHINPKYIHRLRQGAFSKRSMNRPMVRLLRELSHFYQIGILSNAGFQTRQLIEDIFHLDRYVEEIIISAEEGVIKPDPRIYQIAMERLIAEPERTLFLDDYRVNVQAAQDFGMKAVQFINNKQAVRDIKLCLNGKAA